ncbi:helix-turn-helix domain-containing protein [Mangrovicoccus sp. HB161399]|uniref:helix-turn-helix domain-containing protein n=1 Tax=Mangrovicoccus sp. HB161399 TaxID=2720392 RepID=UPI001556755C|nr:helix-turn-helix domain-containing protein [Mangrovicoccus sp. HB161399]
MPKWNTEEQVAEKQFGFWREVVCAAFVALDPRHDGSGKFSGKVSADLVGKVNVCEQVTDNHSVHRTRHEIARMPVECYFVNMQVAGDVRVDHCGRETLVKPGEFYIVDSTEPYSLDYRGGASRIRTFSFRFPKALLQPVLPRSRAFMALPVCRQTAAGDIAADFLASLARRAENIPPETAPSLERMATDIVAMALGARTDAGETTAASRQEGLLHSVKLHIERNLSDPGLGVEGVCARFRISPRYLHRLFEQQERSFAREIAARRLARCALALRTDPNVPVSQIAYGAGFGDLSGFNRQFRKEFGVSPRTYRTTAQTAPHRHS